MNQKGCQTTKNNSQNWIYICVLSLQVIVFSWTYESQGIQTKNPFDGVLSLSFDLRFLKVNNNALGMNQFCKGLSKGLI
jgi:heme-binding NEAT domain protein